MLNFLTKKKTANNKANQKVILTLFVLFLYRFGSSIPLAGIDQEALSKSFLQLDNRNAIMQIINMYSGGGTNLLTPFSLGIIPFINASIIIDLLTALFPYLEKLQSEEGEAGKKKLVFYKKIVTFIFSIVQSVLLISYLKNYFYSTEIINLSTTALELVTGSMVLVWLSNIIDTKGIGNGTSIIILTNIVIGIINKNLLPTNLTNFASGSFIIQIGFVLLLMIFICISQTARINIEVVSARQLAFLEDLEKANIANKVKTVFQLKDNGLSIRLNQAGIFPIIIASNLIPFLTFIGGKFFEQNSYIGIILYYLLIVGFNYFYTIVFWDPEKIAEQLRKASVSVVNITPGQDTVSYLESVVKSTSILGGLFLCMILFFYDFIKSFLQPENSVLLNQINISSLIIVVGVAYEIQKTVRALYKNVIEDIT